MWALEGRFTFPISPFSLSKRFPPFAKRKRQTAGAQPNGLLRKAQMVMLLGYVNIIRKTYINIGSMTRIKVISDCTSKLVQT